MMCLVQVYRVPQQVSATCQKVDVTIYIMGSFLMGVMFVESLRDEKHVSAAKYLIFRGGEKGNENRAIHSDFSSQACGH